MLVCQVLLPSSFWHHWVLIQELNILCFRRYIFFYVFPFIGVHDDDDDEKSWRIPLTIVFDASLNCREVLFMVYLFFHGSPAQEKQACWMMGENRWALVGTCRKCCSTLSCAILNILPKKKRWSLKKRCCPFLLHKFSWQMGARAKIECLQARIYNDYQTHFRNLYCCHQIKTYSSKKKGEFDSTWK